MKTYVILYNLRSILNVGAIFRTADGAGVEKIYLAGYTPSPIDRFGRIQLKMKKAALGATESVKWEHCDDAAKLIAHLKEEGIAIVAVEQREGAIDYRDFVQNRDTAYIFGNERDGVPEDLSMHADAVVDLPMAGSKESLNVATAAGIVLYSTRTRT